MMRLLCDPLDVSAKLAKGETPPWADEPETRTGSIVAVDRLLIGTSAPMAALKRLVHKVSRTNCTVLITGETGSGKECVARLIHQLGGRRAQPLVSINCAAVPDGLLEGELFGHERGAFTGAHAAYPGKVKLADRGTLFLDEIGDMSLQAQAKVLRALETGEIHPLGGTRGVRVDVRVIAATNQPLEALMSSGRFRKDLYFRLNVAHIEVPPLRERLEDVSELAACFIGYFNRQMGRAVSGVSEAAMARLLAHPWTGNVRELRNVLEAAFVNAEPTAVSIEVADLPAGLRSDASRVSNAAPAADDERRRLLEALARFGGNKTAVARELHWSRMTLYRKLAKYGIAGAGAPAAEVPGAHAGAKE